MYVQHPECGIIEGFDHAPLDFGYDSWFLLRGAVEPQVIRE